MVAAFILPVLLAAGAPSGEPAGQVTSVAQSSDIAPGDWPAQTLGRLIARYGCIAGGTASTYRGNRPMTRLEFAAGFDACRDALRSRILQDQGPNSQDAEDIRTIEQQFAPELQVLSGRADRLNARTKTLEAEQFSNTTKLDPPGSPSQQKGGRRSRPPQ